MKKILIVGIVLLFIGLNFLTLAEPKTGRLLPQNNQRNLSPSNNVYENKDGGKFGLTEMSDDHFNKALTSFKP